MINLPKISKSTTHVVEKESDFPIEIFPKGIQNYFKEANEKLSSNIDFMACSFLWGTSILSGNSFEIEVKTGWKDKAILWIACVGNAGTGKTHSMSMATRPFENLNDNLISSFYAKKELWKNSPDVTEPEPTLEQFIVNDITVEALVQLHSQNKNCVSMLREEMDGWFKNMSRYSNGSDQPFWLSTFSGKSVSMNRKSGNNYLSKPFISILGGIQPTILESFSTEENKSNGFLDRILLCAPDISVDMYNSNEMSYEGMSWFDDFVENFFNYCKSSRLINEAGDINPLTFKLDEDSKKEWEKIYNKITIMQNSDEENEYMKSMLPKQKTYIPRFILLLHLMHNFTQKHIPLLIKKDIVLKAGLLSDYFILQAQKVKVEAKEANAIDFIIANKKNSDPETLFREILKKGGKINFTKVADKLGVSRQTLTNWRKT